MDRAVTAADYECSLAPSVTRSAARGCFRSSSQRLNARMSVWSQRRAPPSRSGIGAGNLLCIPGLPSAFLFSQDLPSFGSGLSGIWPAAGELQAESAAAHP